jgi:cytochrome c oxidase subunit IV
MSHTDHNQTHVKKNVRPFSSYVSIWLGLLALTIVTITVAGLNLGSFSVLGAIVIATIKSSLVVWFFMNIKYEDKVFKLMLGLAIFTLTIILLLTFADTAFR